MSVMPGTTPARAKLQAGRPVTPMSERQQMRLVRQLVTSDTSPGTPQTPDGPKKSRRCNGRGETPLHRAAIRGDADAVKKLLIDGADPNVQDFAGWTALHEACNHGWLEVAEALLDAGADVNIRGFDDDTPLHDATGNAHIDLARLLVERGAEIQAVNRRGKTACDLAPPGMLPYLLHSDCIENVARNFGGNDTSATAEMRRTRVEKSPRVTLKLHHIKKRSGKLNFDDFTTSSPVISAMEEKTKDDVYEFKSSKEATPVRGNSTSPDVENPVNEVKAEIKTEDSESVSLGKRAADHETDDVDDESKRKKKKEEGAAKEGKVVTTASRLAAVRGANAVAKAQNLTPSKVAVPPKTCLNLDRKSPGSPKGGASQTVPSPTGSKGEAETDGDGERLGPKVPPLKIVIPQSGGQEPEQGGARNGKNNSSRHSALPYVVSSNSNDSEKDGSVSPTEHTLATLTLEEQKSAQHQRVLRSHRGTEPPSRPASAGSGSPPAVNANPISTSASGNSNESSPPSKPEVTANPPAVGSPPAMAATPPTLDPTVPSTSSSGSTKGSNPSTPGSVIDDKSQDTADAPAPAPDIHPRKRKLKHRNTDSKEAKEAPAPAEGTEVVPVVDPKAQDQPVKSCYQLYLDIRKQVERRRQNLFPVQPKPPHGFKDYLLNRGSYLLASNASTRQIPSSPVPVNLPPGLMELFTAQERERHKLRLQHIIEKEKLVLSVEQEILRVHGRAARALANQSVPFSVCTVLRDKEVYNLITPEQEEKDRNNARSRYNGRLFLGWLQDVDDKWEKIKENMNRRHQNEAESLHAVQKMNWEWKMVELGLCLARPRPQITNEHVPPVHCSVDFDLLPA